MILDSNDDDSEESDFISIAGEDVDVHLNHYRVPKLLNYSPYGNNSPSKSRSNREQIRCNNEGKIMTLTELAAQKVACHLPFGLVEHFDPPVPEPMQCRIAFWSFPQDEEDVRLYTCLANGNTDVFFRAEELICQNAVRDMLQVGFHLSANVQFLSETEDLEFFKVAITFDRRRITSCSCSCSTFTIWCQHVVAVCLQRIRKPLEVKLRAPVSESLQRLEKNQLQKFAQYLINELPQQILPAAQKLLDELLSGDEAVINRNPAAPDPTAGATINEQTSWCLDYTHLSMDIHRILLKQCTAQPTVCSDIQSLHVTAPPVTTEYSQLLRPIRGREPEGIWNLISIVGEMMKRRDPNLFPLLEIMTEEIMKFDKIVTWWFETKVSLHSGSTVHLANTKNSQCTSQYSCSNFCDEIVHLWRIAALNPSASPTERERLRSKFFDWHLAILKKHGSITENSTNGVKSNKRNFLELFPGFKSAMEGCMVDWSGWDEKKGKLCSMDEDGVTEVEKPVRQGKRRKRRSKASKHQNAATIDPKPSASNEIESVVSENQEEPEPNENSVDPQEVSQADQENEREENDEANNVEVAHEQDVREDLDDELVQRDPLQNLNFEQQENRHNLDILELEQDLQVYFMERQPGSPQKVQKPESLEDLIKVNIKKLADPLETLYAKVEGLHAHGHLEEARKVARKVATEILNQRNYPSLKQLYTLPRRRKKKGSLDNQMSIVASETLAKISFLCSVLTDDLESHGLIFKLAMFGVELKRSPAATKPLEVKLINQKQELIGFLKNIVLHEDELVILREKADAMKADDLEENHSDALTQLILGNYIFDALVLSKSPSCADCNARLPCERARGSSSSSHHQYQMEEHYLQTNDINSSSQQQQPSSHNFDQIRQCPLMVHGKLPSDANLGFQAALSALGCKANILETDHPLLCEGIRRQRGELALSLIIHYKDDQEKLDLILKQLLDKDLVMSLNSLVSGRERQALTKKNAPSQDPNHPTEASAHFMFELAKTVFDKAGGNSTTAHLFRPQLVAQNGARGVHRKLHMCTLRIALHAVGLQNLTSPKWMQRTYNGRASFIHEQALEIGLPAIKYLCENWEGYLTPVEAASVADKAGCSNDAEIKRIAAEMAKSCLKYANFLDYNAVSRILAQCKEQTIEMIEEACSEIEQIAESDSVCADVLFATARAWHGLYLKLVMNERCMNGSFYPLITAEQDTGASDWLAVSGQPHSEKRQQFNEPLHPLMWDAYARADFILTVDTPIYKNIDYVRSAFRVGIKALDSLNPAVPMGSKHSPKTLDEILWLLGLSKSLGRDCLYKFSQSVIKNITDPYILHIIIIDLIKFFETIALPEDHADRVNVLMPIFDKCLDRCLKQTKDLMRHISYDQKSCVETIFEVVQTLTTVTQTLAAAQYYWEILKFVEHKMDKRHKRSRIYINIGERRVWIKNFATDLNVCACDDCWAKRGVSQRHRFKTLYQSN